MSFSLVIRNESPKNVICREILQLTQERFGLLFSEKDSRIIAHNFISSNIFKMFRSISTRKSLRSESSFRTVEHDPRSLFKEQRKVIRRFLFINVKF